MQACRRARVPAPEAMACVTVGSPLGSFDLIGVHIPTYGRPNDRVLKVETQEALLTRMAKLSAPTLLCGDFNAPFAEEADGTVVPFARRRGSRQYEAEAGSSSARNMDLYHGLPYPGAYNVTLKKRSTHPLGIDTSFAGPGHSTSACTTLLSDVHRLLQSDQGSVHQFAR